MTAFVVAVGVILLLWVGWRRLDPGCDDCDGRWGAVDPCATCPYRAERIERGEP